jgi:hypothetical protein
VIADADLAPSSEVRAHLLQQLNLVLRRPEMYGGGETTPQVLISLLGVVERRPELLAAQQREWAAQGAWTPLGVAGAFHPELPDAHDLAAMSVYVEFARRRGWLRTDRLVDADAHAAMCRALPAWAGQDRSWPDVRAAFGPPSVLIGGRNPRWSKALCYVPEGPAEPVVTFHLRNDPDAGTAQPALLAVRRDEGPFPERFTFTPEGRRRRPGS